MKTKLINWIKDFSSRHGAKGWVINISGGKDSTVVAKLLVEAVGKDNVLGILQPNGDQKDISDSYKVIDYLGIKSVEVNINDLYTNIINLVSSNNITLSDKSCTNVPPRLRANIAYAIAQTLGYRVAGTGNRSERYIGWFTKFGDAACDMNPIAPLTCTQVIKLGEELGIPYELIHKTPSDGLSGKSDEDNFGFTYDQLDKYILTGTSGDDNIDDKIRKMHKSVYHKGGVYTWGVLVTDYETLIDIYSPVWFNEDGSYFIQPNLLKDDIDLNEYKKDELIDLFIHNLDVE